MPNDDFPFSHGGATDGDHLSTDKPVASNPYLGPYGPSRQQGASPVPPGSTAPQRRIALDDPTVQMPRPAAPAGSRWPSPQEATQEPPVRPSRRGASFLRWIARIICLGMLAVGALTITYLTEQAVDQTSSLSAAADAFAQKGAWLVQSGQSPSFEDDPVKWLGERILLLSVKFSNHGLSVRQQAHVVEFALLGGVMALNVLAWMSGWAHRRDALGRIHGWRTVLMFALSSVLCAAASLADQYHKLSVPGRHFDKLDLVLDASGYMAAIFAVFMVWSAGSALYRLVFRK